MTELKTGTEHEWYTDLKLSIEQAATEDLGLKTRYIKNKSELWLTVDLKHIING